MNCYPDTALWEPPADSDPEAALRAEALAWSTLEALAGMQLALCPVTVRPAKRSSAHGLYYVAPVGTSVIHGQWTNVWCGHHSVCGCTGLSTIALPGPVAQVDSVKIDGAVLDPEAYRVDNDALLVRQDGGTWPIDQNFDLPSGAVGTFEVTYRIGGLPTELVNYAVGVLAGEYLAAIEGRNCRLPSGVRSITRQGVAMELQSDLFGDGFTGIAEVDVVIRMFNPYALKGSVTIASPDTMQPRVIRL